MTTTLFYAALVFMCLALSFLLSGMEAGVFALSRLRIRQQRRSGRYPARVLQQFLDNPEDFLWTILVGNTLATFTAFSIVIVPLGRWLQERAGLFLLTCLVLAFVFYVFCDLLPKMLFRQFPNRLCLMMAVPFRVVHLALVPLVFVLNWLAGGLVRIGAGGSFTGTLFGTRNELRWVMTEASPNLTSEERSMINRVLDLQALTVGAVMVPLPSTLSVSAQTSLGEVVKLCREKQRTRLPVWSEEGGRRRWLGIVNLRQFLYQADYDPRASAARYARPTLHLRENVRLENAFREMQRTGHRFAMVIGPDNREVGVVSMQDILKTIFGEVSL